MIPLSSQYLQYVSSGCLFPVHGCPLTPGMQVITEKAGNASLLGQIVGVVYAWIFPLSETPCYVTFSSNLGRNAGFIALIP